MSTDPDHTLDIDNGPVHTQLATLCAALACTLTDDSLDHDIVLRSREPVEQPQRVDVVAGPLRERQQTPIHGHFPGERMPQGRRIRDSSYTA